MKARLLQILANETQAFFTFKKTERTWHIPILAALSVGIPLLLGLYFENIKAGATASLAGIVILYMPIMAFKKRMRTLVACSFGFMVSMLMGLVFSFHPIVAIIMLGLYSFTARWFCLYFRVRPPGSFFFIMLAAIAVCMPFHLESIPEKVGLIGLGTMNACILALIYSVLTFKKNTILTTLPINTTKVNIDRSPPDKNKVTRDAIIMGLTISLSLWVGYFFDLQKPYWLPISCAAVMQGGSTYHIWQRSLQRITGTFIGVGLAWLTLANVTSLLNIFIVIMTLQFIVEMLIARNYTFAVIFITPLTLLLTEVHSDILNPEGSLMLLRFWNIAIGSAMGAVGGWLSHGISSPADRNKTS